MLGDGRERDLVSVHDDGERGVYTAKIPDASEGRPSVFVPHVVAMATGRDVDALPPLYACIDPDALDALFADRPTGHARTEGEVTFPYDGVTVTLTADGDVRIRLRESGYDARVER